MRPTPGPTLHVVCTISSSVSFGLSSMATWKSSTICNRSFLAFCCPSSLWKHAYLQSVSQTWIYLLCSVSVDSLLDSVYWSREQNWELPLNRGAGWLMLESFQENSYGELLNSLSFCGRTGERCNITFKPCGLFGKELHKVEGYILDKRYLLNL